MIKEADLVRALAEQVGLEFVDLTDSRSTPSPPSLLPEALARRYRALPDRRTRRAAPGRDVRPRERLCARRHPNDHRAATCCRSSPPPRDVEAAIQKFTGHGLGTSRRWPAASTPPATRARSDDLDAARRGRADRQARQRDHDPGRRRPRVRHPHRADRARSADPVPHRRRAARGRCARAQEHPGRPHQPPEGHGRHQHRREARPAGRPHLDEGRRQADRPACRDPADRLRREGRHPRSSTRANALLRARGPRVPARTSYKRFEPAFRKPYGAILVTGPTGRASRRRCTRRSTS